MEFKIDKNLPSEACDLFRKDGHDAVSVLNQHLGGRPDAEIVSVCKTESRILITLDTDFGNILAYPPEDFAGIIVIRSDDQARATILNFVRRMIAVLRSESPRGQLWIVEHNRIRVRGLE